MRTLNQILIDANSTLDLEATAPTSTELTLRVNYANQAIFDASGVAQLPEFKNEYIGNISTAVTLPLPSNFRELQENPRLLSSNGEWLEYEEKSAEEKYDLSTADKYCYVLGNPQSGYNLIFNAPEANATVSIIYQRYPSGMATLTDKCELSDPTYVTRKIESYVLYGRSDDKFQIAESRANVILQNMVARRSKSTGGQSQDTKMKFKNPLA